LSKPLIKLGFFFISSICQVNSNFFAEVLGNLLQGQTSSLREEEVDDWINGEEISRKGQLCNEILPGIKTTDQQMITR
jgi:hypothetical protein